MIKKDPLFNIKHIAYRNVITPVGPDNFKLFVRGCQLGLAIKTHRLMKDPIFDTYTPEEIIAEYYSHLYSTDKQAREEFEAQMRGQDIDKLNDFYSWTEKMIEDNKKDLEAHEETLEKDLSFNPADLGKA